LLRYVPFVPVTANTWKPPTVFDLNLIALPLPLAVVSSPQTPRRVARCVR
jgi:hypothetical protein